MGTQAEPLAKVVGRNLATIRRKKGLRQDDVAARARGLGLNWTRATVAALEIGRRLPDLAEAVLLQVVLGVPLRDLLAGSDPIELATGSGRTWPASEARKLIPAPRPADLDWAWLSDAAIAAGQIAEQRTAQRLGVTPEQVAAAAFKLWGQGLTDERDARYEATGNLDTDRFGRARVSESLMEDLANSLGPKAVKRWGDAGRLKTKPRLTDEERDALLAAASRGFGDAGKLNKKATAAKGGRSKSRGKSRTSKGR
jgi:transcriptional regulator with XRE-family HTH domain